MGELAGLTWDMARTLAAIVGSAFGVWGFFAQRRARAIETRWKEPEPMLLLTREEEGWVQGLLLVRNRQDIEWTIEQVEIVDPAAGRLATMADWETRQDGEFPGATSSVSPAMPVLAGPPEGQRSSAKLPIFISAPEWDPTKQTAELRLTLRESSRDRRRLKLPVVSLLMKLPAQIENEGTAISNAPLDQWIGDVSGWMDRLPRR